jgi:hypothetical protein
MSDENPLCNVTGTRNCAQAETIKAMSVSIKRIENALLGDPTMRVKGALDRLEEHNIKIDLHEMEIVRLKDLRNKVVAWGLAASTILIALWEVAKVTIFRG